MSQLPLLNTISRGLRPQFQTFVSTIVILQDSLPYNALAQLLDVDLNEIISTLSNLARGRDHTYRVHHRSFSNFICDCDRCTMGPEFHVSPALRQALLADHERECEVQHLYLDRNGHLTMVQLRPPPRLMLALLGVPSNWRPRRQYHSKTPHHKRTHMLRVL